MEGELSGAGDTGPVLFEERQRFVAHLTSDKNAVPVVEEAIWALINCSAFRFNH